MVRSFPRLWLCLVCLLIVDGSRSPTPCVAQSDALRSEPMSDAGVTSVPTTTASNEQIEQSELAQEARQAAKEAEPHAIVPSPTNPRRPAFQLYTEIDLPILGVGLVFAAARLVLSQKAYCAPLCDKKDLNQLDRKTAGTWHPRWQLGSNIAIYSLAGGIALFLGLDEGIMNGLNDAVVIAESALAAMAVASIMTLAANRPRPFLYGTEAPLSERNGSDAGLSFLSSHASIAFAAATATWMAARRLHPNSRANWIVAGVGGALAAVVAVARVLGGMHFITDALGGAVVGMSLGVLIPALHKSPTRVLANASRHAPGLSIVTRF